MSEQNKIKKSRQAKNILINKDFQLKIIGVFGLLIIAVTLTYATAIYLVLEDFISMGKSVGLDDSHVFFDFMARQKSLFFKFFVVTFSGVTVIFLYIGFVISHRIAGPLYRFNNHLKKISETGEFGPIKFRDGDFFIELSESFNKAIKRR